MNSKIFIALFFSFWGLTMNLQAQSVAKQQQTDEKERQRLIVEFQQKGKYSTYLKQSVQVQTNKYNHHETEILSKLNVSEIPADFPVYRSEYSASQYADLMSKWYDSNPSLLKKETSNSQK
jgi:hypothetical protein